MPFPVGVTPGKALFRHRLVSVGVHGQAQFPPDTAIFLTMLFHLPFSLPEKL
jgi:hypothetical protein